jgi:SAM-dependent methyltransferase
VRVDASEDVRHRQEAFYERPESERFEWMTKHPAVVSAEQRLLASLDGLTSATEILEVGCGEGANLVTMRAIGVRAGYTGFDCFPSKVAFCRAHHASARFLVADARRPFPFRDDTYDRVLIRDVLHHMIEPDRIHVLREALRVLAPGGTLSLIEGNARNLLGFAFAMLLPHERCMLDIRAPHLQRFVAKTLPGLVSRQLMDEPSNLFRLLFHYRFGLPALARIPGVMPLLSRWNQVVRTFWPERTWAYSIVEIRKPDVPPPYRIAPETGS